MIRFYKFSLRFYLIALGITIPFYFLFYGASGHQINIPSEDKIWIMTFIFGFITTMAYLRIKEEDALLHTIVKTLVALSAMGTLYFGSKAFLSMMNFKFGDDVSFLIQGLSYILPLIFIITNVVVFIGLFRKFE
ncbi:MAG TPA: hypothetical protein VL443_18245 [Cyclobacteriaceae bacterium]|jgi:hypothetical protein|nr:hypothetical protein [Cyclobacteriaceae bacterium]